MLDKPEKTRKLIEILKAAVPFEAELIPPVLAHLSAENVASNIPSRQLVREIFYAGDEGGIVCNIEPDGERPQNPLIVSLTHLYIRRTLPFAAAVLDYQKHRIKKLKQQRSSP